MPLHDFKKNILILVLSNLKHDARVRRQLFALTNKYNLTVVCFDGDSSDLYKLVRVKPTNLTLTRKMVVSLFLLLKLHSIAYKILHNYAFIIKELENQKFDAIIANDIETIPLAFSFPGKAKIIFDAHEYAPRHFEDKIMWRIFFQDFNTFFCKKYIPKVAAMMTVGKGLAREYEKHYGIRPTVITNANQYYDKTPSPVGDDTIRLVHHGIATPSRKLELMIDLMFLLDNRFTLDLILLTPGFASSTTQNYISTLREKAKNNTRIKFCDPVKSYEVVDRINEYDMGIFLLPPINFNYENTLPNKLFDFIQARLGVAIGPTPEMAEIVNHYSIGVVSQDFTPQSLATQLNGLTRKSVEDFKKNATAAAMKLNAEKNAETINELIQSALM